MLHKYLFVVFLTLYFFNSNLSAYVDFTSILKERKNFFESIQDEEGNEDYCFYKGAVMGVGSAISLLKFYQENPIPLLEE